MVAPTELAAHLHEHNGRDNVERRSKLGTSKHNRAEHDQPLLSLKRVRTTEVGYPPGFLSQLAVWRAVDLPHAVAVLIILEEVKKAGKG